MGILGNHWSCINGVKLPFKFQEGNQDHCRVTAGESSLITRKVGNLVVFLQLWQEDVGSSQVQRGPQGTSPVDTVESGLLSSCKGHLGIPLESLQGDRALSLVEV